MSLEFSFYVRDGLMDFFQPEELNKLEIKDFPYTHTKEVLLDIIVYCALGDFDQAKKYVKETILFLDSGRRAGIIQRLGTL